MFFIVMLTNVYTVIKKHTYATIDKACDNADIGK
jgi:hypothetical protein